MLQVVFCVLFLLQTVSCVLFMQEVVLRVFLLLVVFCSGVVRNCFWYQLIGVCCFCCQLFPVLFLFKAVMYFCHRLYFAFCLSWLYISPVLFLLQAGLCV